MTLGDKDDGEEFNQVSVKIRCIGLEIYVLTGLKFPEILDRDQFKPTHQVSLCNRMDVDGLRIEEFRLGDKFLVFPNGQVEDLLLRHTCEDGQDLHLFVNVLQGLIPGDLLDLNVLAQGQPVVVVNYVHVFCL